MPLFIVPNTPPPAPRLLTLPLNVAVYPSSPPPTVTMFRIPPTPSASYFALGLVITSMCLMELAGILFRTSVGLLLIMLLGLPLTYTLKLLLPFTLMLSSPSTVTRGTLRSISRTEFDLESGSSCTLYSILSISAFTNGFWATISTCPNSLEASVIYMVPKSTDFSPGFTEKFFTILFRPTEEIVIMKLPLLPSTFSWKCPFISVTSIFNACSGASFLTILIVAYGSPSLVRESSKIPLI